MKRFCRQYSLVTTFVVLTILAMGISWYASHMQDVKRQRAIAALIEEQGGFVWYDDAHGINAWEPSVIEKAKSSVLGRRIVFVSLRGGAVGEREITQLAKLSALSQLDLSGTVLNASTASELAKLKNLRTLYLNDALIADSTLADLRASLADTHVIGPSRFELK